MSAYIVAFGAVVMGVAIGLWINDAADVDMAAGVLMGAFIALAAHRAVADVLRGR